MPLHFAMTSCASPRPPVVAGLHHVFEGQDLLKIAFEGGAEEWATLHLCCEDRAFAGAFLALLREAPARQAWPWIEVIQEMHPILPLRPAQGGEGT